MEYLLLLFLLVLSGIFSGSETALVDLSIGRVEGLVKEGRRGARALHELRRDPTRMLTTILIGNNVVNIGASVMATVVATRLFGDAGPGIAVGVLTILILVFGEITPKSLATRYSERISLAVAPPLLLFMRVIFPLVWLFGAFTQWVHGRASAGADPTVTESELISMLGHGEKEGTIEHGEREIIERVFDFHDLKVRDVMTPYGNVQAMAGETTVNAALPELASGTFSRIPLYHGDRENVRKVLYLRDLLAAVSEGRGDAALFDVAHEPVFVPQYQSVKGLFTQLRRHKRHFSIVVDEFGDIRGIVTLEDLIEELVGEIYDESDLAPADATAVSDSELIVSGASELRVVEEFFHVDLPGKPTDSVSLWILERTGTLPAEGSSIAIDGLEVSVVEATARRIEQVQLRRGRSAERHAAPAGAEG